MSSITTRQSGRGMLDVASFFAIHYKNNLKAFNSLNMELKEYKECEMRRAGRVAENAPLPQADLRMLGELTNFTPIFMSLTQDTSLYAELPPWATDIVSNN